jgi:dipeptidyl-peptidase-4
MSGSSGEEGFPRRYARTRRFTLGQPRNFAVAQDGSRIVFLRSAAGDDPVNALWVFDTDSATERQIADPRTILEDLAEDLPPAERARRERAREGASGIVSYAADPGLRKASFALAGQLFVADLVAGSLQSPAAAPGVFDPRPDPTGARVAYVAGGELRITDLEEGEDRVLAAGEGPEISWGTAEFIAAEEMERTRGYWWAPDGKAIVAARVDTSSVQQWYLGDPANPSHPSRTIRYPAVGTANADVSLFVLSLDEGRTEIRWDRPAFPYLVSVSWRENQPLTLVVQSRDQRTMQVLTADPVTGTTALVREDHDPAWLDIVRGVPGWLPDGRLVWTAERDDTRRLIFDDAPVTPPGLQVRRVVHVGGHAVITASEEPTEVHLWKVSGDGELNRLTSDPGVHDGAAGGDVVVVVSATMGRSGSVARVTRGGEDRGVVRSFAEAPPIRPNVLFEESPGRDLRCAVLFPTDGRDGPFPVLLDPYGGPHSQRVLRAQDAFLQSQWFADQGFVVLVADGRGTPGRGPAWERAVQGDLASPALEDQIEALHAASDAHPGSFDLDRVAIRGWSFGGYLAALAVLRHPDVFHAAIAGAPVTDWRLYDTHYTERYLGLPDENPEAYRRSSLIEDAAKLERPLLLIHGLADDNVVAAHTLRLSAALLDAGRPHSVLPLSGVTHMTPQEVVAENLLLLQVAFLRQALKLDL